MNNYQWRKSKARDEAITWQREQSNRVTSYGELALDQDRFAKLARRYGLVNEFKENGII